MGNAIGCLVPMLLGHLMCAYFLGSIVARTKGDDVGLMVGIGYALLFPFLIWLGWGLGAPIGGHHHDH